jgi:hypothetical protein
VQVLSIQVSIRAKNADPSMPHQQSTPKRVSTAAVTFTAIRLNQCFGFMLTCKSGKSKENPGTDMPVPGCHFLLQLAY